MVLWCKCSTNICVSISPYQLSENGLNDCQDPNAMKINPWIYLEHRRKIVHMTIIL